MLSCTVGTVTCEPCPKNMTTVDSTSCVCSEGYFDDSLYNKNRVYQESRCLSCKTDLPVDPVRPRPSGRLQLNYPTYSKKIRR